VTASTLGFEPASWQRALLGLVVVLAVVPALALVVELVRRHVLEPRAAGRRWPEGLGRWVVGEVPAEIGAALQTEDLLPPGSAKVLSDLAVAVGVGAAFAALVALPVSPDIRAVDPSAGVVLWPVTVLLWALADMLGTHAVLGGAGRTAAADRALRRSAAVVVLVLAALAVGAQAGSGAFRSILEHQTRGVLLGFQGVGLPYVIVQAVAFGAALLAVHALAVSDDRADPEPRGIGGMRRVAVVFGDTVIVVGGAAWIAVAFLGAGATPWRISTTSVRTVVDVLLFAGKVTVVVAGLLWALGRWPRVDQDRALQLLGGAAAVLVLDIAVTGALRAWV
jgi:NADH:ubiquinone oxidoreductase subunit H